MTKLFKDTALNHNLNYLASFIDPNHIQYVSKGFQDKEVQFDIASITKLLTSTRILQLIENNHLSLETNVSTILPITDKLLTIEALLFHESGFLPSVHIRHTHQRTDIIESILNCDDQTQDKTYEYSCINFLILGFIIEAIDQMTLAKSFDAFIFKPLNMKNTCFNPQDKRNCVPSERSRKQGEVHDVTALKLGGIAGNAGLFSTIKDLSLFVQDFTQNNSKLLKKETKEILINTKTKDRYLGWNKLQYEAKHYHTAFTGPMVLVDFENKKGFVFLNNAIYPHRENTNYKDYREQILINYLKYYR